MPDDLTSGVYLCYFLEEVANKRLPKWSKNPPLRVHKIENLSIALKFIQGELGVKLVGIGPEGERSFFFNGKHFTMYKIFTYILY